MSHVSSLSNYLSNHAVAHVVIAADQPVAQDDDLYHVTFYRNLRYIAEEGLMPDQRRTIGTSIYDEHRRGRIFLCGKGDVSFWYEKAETFALDESDDFISDGAVPVVLRIVDSWVEEVSEDTVAATESRRSDSWFYEGSIDASHLEVWTGDTWTSVDNYEAIDLVKAVDPDGFFLRNNPLANIPGI